MKYLIVVFMVLALSCLSLFAQTIPPPTEAPEIKYKAQICWGAISEDKWEDIVITYTVKLGSLPAQHKFNGKIGLQTFVAQASNSYINIVEFSFSIASLPDNSPNSKFWYYYVRLFGYTEVDGDIANGLISDISDWVSIHEIGKPGKPVGK